jgi:hypothetical protein
VGAGGLVYVATLWRSFGLQLRLDREPRKARGHRRGPQFASKPLGWIATIDRNPTIYI